VRRHASYHPPSNAEQTIPAAVGCVRIAQLINHCMGRHPPHAPAVVSGRLAPALLLLGGCAAAHSSGRLTAAAAVAVQTRFGPPLRLIN